MSTSRTWSKWQVCLLQMLPVIIMSTQQHHCILWTLLFLGSGCFADHQFQWQPRALVYPDPGESETKVQVLFGLGLPMEGEVSVTLGYVLKCNYALPYGCSNCTTSRAGRRLDGKKNRFVGASRWSLYRMLETAVGRTCLLRTICEAAELPLLRSGLLGQLLHVLLTPTTTEEKHGIYTDRQFLAAETLGRNKDCRHFYRDCPYSPLDYFTQIIDSP